MNQRPTEKTPTLSTNASIHRLATRSKSDLFTNKNSTITDWLSTFNHSIDTSDKALIFLCNNELATAGKAAELKTLTRALVRLAKARTSDTKLMQTLVSLAWYTELIVQEDSTVKAMTSICARLEQYEGKIEKITKTATEACEQAKQGTDNLSNLAQQLGEDVVNIRDTHQSLCTISDNLHGMATDAGQSMRKVTKSFAEAHKPEAAPQQPAKASR
ncbi:hypothetical protein SCP_0704700 [Sparassis crispa]|uniref:Uncharacterized protein n=1 Tax=Sparassis crispa TaxID=139825 RepID=A0A401GSX2_9APHY|nr:hypothetical protein SCP_0704700 [Sparassis crispa]GBE85283.1 hypothetical protein SCP_0704700 [Sparassis crispa]